MDRTSLSPALFTVHEVADALGVTVDVCRPWLEEHDLLRHAFGREWVVWARVVDAIDRGDAPQVKSGLLTTAEAAALLGISRNTLDTAISKAPPGLPGAPVDVSTGGKHHHWRWDAAELATWWSAYQDHAKGRKKVKPSRSPSKPKPRKQAVPDGYVDWAAVGRGRG